MPPKAKAAAKGKDPVKQKVRRTSRMHTWEYTTAQLNK